jgi:hypothetical protein
MKAQGDAEFRARLASHHLEAARTARVVRRFGELLAAWPAIVEAAKELRRRGRRLAVPVRNCATRGA